MFLVKTLQLEIFKILIFDNYLRTCLLIFGNKNGVKNKVSEEFDYPFSFYAQQKGKRRKRKKNLSVIDNLAAIGVIQIPLKYKEKKEDEKEENPNIEYRLRNKCF